MWDGRSVVLTYQPCILLHTLLLLHCSPIPLLCCLPHSYREMRAWHLSGGPTPSPCFIALVYCSCAPVVVSDNTVVAMHTMSTYMVAPSMSSATHIAAFFLYLLGTMWHRDGTILTCMGGMRNVPIFRLDWGIVI